MGSQLAGILAAKFLKVPCVAHLRDFEEVDKVTKLYAKLINSHIAISEAIKDNLSRLAVQEDKIVIIHDAIDINDFDKNISCEYLRKEFNLEEQEKLFGIFGRVIPWKGIKEFVRAAALVFQSLPKAKGLIVGDFSDGDKTYVDEVRELITHYGLDNHIILTGYRKDVPAIMQLMDVIVHASIKPEPFGMVLIEGMAMGKPIVATKMGGPLDIVIDGQTGFLVEPGDIKNMANAVLRILAEKPLAETMGRDGHDRVTALFTKERYARQVEKVYMHELGIG
jgi:glycosyltransferase involved in cell wall biosynthesis